MIYTVGYSGMTPHALKELVAGLDARVVDVRSSPRSRKPGFGSQQLGALLGDRYSWHPELGGQQSRIAASDIRTLKERALDLQNKTGRHALLMCMEESPGDCHRHRMLHEAIPYMLHIYRDEVIRASELQRAIVEGDDYEWTDLGDHFR